MGKQSYLSIPKDKHDWTLVGKKPNCLFLDPRYIGKQLSNSRGELHWKTIQMFTLSRGMGGKKGWRKRKKLYIHCKRRKRLEGKKKKLPTHYRG